VSGGIAAPSSQLQADARSRHTPQPGSSLLLLRMRCAACTQLQRMTWRSSSVADLTGNLLRRQSCSWAGASFIYNRRRTKARTCMSLTCPQRWQQCEAG
jgi:hypothetical protein